MKSDAQTGSGKDRSDNFFYLFGALVVLTIAAPVLEGIRPGSFSGLEQQGHALSWRFLYFSFVTLTTLGYGDVLPLTLYAQSLTYLETVLGQFYLAVLVAALVSAYLSDRERPSEAEARERIGKG